MTERRVPTIVSIASGYGGLCELGLAAYIGGRVILHAEIDPGASKILAHHWPDTPNIGDITKVNWGEVMPPGSPTVDWLTAGYP